MNWQNGQRKTLMILSFAVITVLMAVSCEAIFTTSALESFARDPSLLPPAQKIAFAEDALASGDPAAISEAYDTIKDYLDDADLDGDEAVEVNTLAVELLAADSGVGPLFDDSVAGLISGSESDPSTVMQDLQDLDISASDSADMQAYMDAIIENDGEPSATQALVAATVVLTPLLDSYPTVLDGTDTFNDVGLAGDDLAAFNAATSYINLAIADLGADSSEGEMLYGLTDLFGMGVNPN